MYAKPLATSSITRSPLFHSFHLGGRIGFATFEVNERA